MVATERRPEELGRMTGREKVGMVVAGMSSLVFVAPVASIEPRAIIAIAGMYAGEKLAQQGRNAYHRPENPSQNTPTVRSRLASYLIPAIIPFARQESTEPSVSSDPKLS